MSASLVGSEMCIRDRAGGGEAELLKCLLRRLRLVYEPPGNAGPVKAPRRDDRAPLGASRR
eukprot:475518-Alexandrium_andersonii.AAC.1